MLAHKLSLQKAALSRLYARHLLTLAAAVATAEHARRNFKVNSTLCETIAKPSEWSSGIDLFERRAEFGKQISSLGSTKLSRVWAAGSRIVSLSLLACPLFVLTPLAALAGKDSKIDKFTWEYALWSIEQAGPTFIKLTQWASTRNDLFSAEFVSNFSRLQDETRGHSWNETVKLLTKTFGADYDALLQLDTTPIGSGCIAQVYRATLQKPTSLHPKGAQVAVKVQHPHILHKVCVDFYILNKITAFLESIPFFHMDYLSIKDSVDQFRDIMLPQLDLRVEAANLSRFRRDFANEDQVTFPQPIHELTTADVLIESFVNGEPILNYLREHHTDEERQELATIGLETVMKMIFLHDFVHADLHPGNILVDRNTSKRGSPLRLNMIDCGLVVEMGEREHVNLTKILGAFIKRDGLSAGQLMVDTAKKCQATDRDVELFCQGIQNICDEDEQNNFLENVGDYLAEICFLACRHKVKLEAAFINAALACEIMEGIASSLYPSMEVQRIALPMVVKAELMHGLKGFKVPGLRS